MYRIVKKFEGYPFAHRQHKHGGHCKLIHGHNWTFEICLQAKELDENGFVYDFGKFKALKQWFEEKFDHTCLINKDDPQLPTFKLLATQGLLDLVEVESGSAEGLAKMVYEKVDSMISANLMERGVELVFVRVFEDHKNSAQYTGP